MAKAKAFIPVSVLASALSIPTVALAQGPGLRLDAELVQRQQAGYHDRTSADTQYSMNFQAALSRVQAQKQTFERYGGVSSSSAACPSQVAANKPIYFGS